MSASISSASSSVAGQPFKFALRTMTEADLPACHRLSLQLKWPHRLEDWQFLLRMGHGVVIENHQEKQAPTIVGTAICCHYGKHHTAIGMLIVQPGLQGYELGRRLMQQLQEQTASRIAIVNATAAGQPLYEKLGFTAVDTLHQYQSSIVPPLLIALPPGERVRPLGKSDNKRIEALDALATGMDRNKVLAAILNVAEGVAIDHDGEMLGFALVRRFGHGRVIGPVVAPDAQHAKALIAHWINMYSDSFIRIDVFESSGLSSWLSEIGLTRVDSVRQMQKNTDGIAWPKPASGMQLFSIINQALG
jgi:ribosomal protein S18 acetylase RimI-like enzyme